ncbi:MAG: glycerol-3-phosphate dehydrogenase subunit GlpB [Spirochaetes bacterium]|nr:glycerol-3-phosphate dehydrogenase subunit GlpB [Spirochaetota bacterium]
MNYDCVIMGGGISALTCGISCAAAGLRTGIISGGMSALHFSSGSIDLYGYHPDRKIVYRPFEQVEELIGHEPNHPYAKCGMDTIRGAMTFFKEQVAKGGLELYDNGDANHFHVSTMGTVKPTYFSQRSVFNEAMKEEFRKRPKIALLTFTGYRDYYPELAAVNLKKSSLFAHLEIVTGEVTLPIYGRTSRNPHEFRSIDIARIFDSERYIRNIADQIRKAAAGAAFAGLPAFIGINNYAKIHRRLSELTGLLVYEIPTLPPSILGMRIDDALKTRFADLGGEFIAGDKINGGEIIDGRLDHVHTENHGTTRIRAKYYVLATGSFFSGGLVSGFNIIREPVFDLRLFRDNERNRWYSQRFLDTAGHPFLEYGVETNGNLNPVTQEGRTVENLFCAGAILAHYNPVADGCGGGVAVSTGYAAAKKIIRGCGAGAA